MSLLTCTCTGIYTGPSLKGQYPERPIPYEGLTESGVNACGVHSHQRTPL